MVIHKKPPCPEQLPRIAVDLKTDKIYEGSAMCRLVDKYCLLETGDQCDTYNEYLATEEHYCIGCNHFHCYICGRCHMEECECKVNLLFGKWANFT